MKFKSARARTANNTYIAVRHANYISANIFTGFRISLNYYLHSCNARTWF
jgi:hypothetical protein